MSIYKWPRLVNIGDSEKIAGLLIGKFSKLEHDYPKRENGFNLKDKYGKRIHQGQCELKFDTDHLPMTEKRFCRALFNLSKEYSNLDTISLLGKILDYEVPLKKDNKSKQGEIDLISYKDNKLFIIEVKAIGSKESILKAVIEAYIYSVLVKDAKQQFVSEFVPGSPKIVPVVLIFKYSVPGKQLINLDKDSIIKKFIDRLNKDLKEQDIDKITFFLITNAKEEIKDCLDAEPLDKKSKFFKVLFKKEFTPKIEQF